MKKRAHFASKPFDRWPTVAEMQPYFLAPPGQEWFFETGNDSAGIEGLGAEGTELLPPGAGRIDVELAMWGRPRHGVLLIYSKWGGGYQQAMTSKGDLGRLRELVYSTHDTPLPVGLFIPFAEAWKAVKEFVETDGALPTSIAWISNDDLPPNTFPDPERGTGYV